MGFLLSLTLKRMVKIQPEIVYKNSKNGEGASKLPYQEILNSTKL